MKSIRYITSCCVTLALVTTALAQETRTITTTRGTYTLDSRGMPDNETIGEVFNELDYQNAVQSYLWAYPQMVVAGQHKMAKYYGATGSLDILLLYKDPGVDGNAYPEQGCEVCY